MDLPSDGPRVTTTQASERATSGCIAIVSEGEVAPGAPMPPAGPTAVAPMSPDGADVVSVNTGGGGGSGSG